MPRLSLAVIVATRGRPATAGLLTRHLAAQTRQADRLIFSVSDANDAPQGCETVTGPPGLAAQRNRGVAAAAGADIYIFFDDDYVPAPGALAAVERLFLKRPDMAGATGHVIADGVGRDPISDLDAARLAHAWTPPEIPTGRDVIGLYGCNMAIRARAAAGLQFDETLPLYGWQEDLDFGARLSARGAVIRTDAFAGVHRGVRAARPKEAGLGYAQIANPVHLMAGGHIPRAYLMRLMARNVIANHVGALTPLGPADRLGRARGNWLALADLARGRLSPQRAAHL